jgi:hypothetical protein
MNFFAEWLGLHGGREVLTVFDNGFKDRKFIDSAKDLKHYVKSCLQHNHPAFVSVQPYVKRKQVLGIEKLFFDFDHEQDPNVAWFEAQDFALSLEQYYDITPLVVFSGKKGYHVYVWFKELVIGFPNTKIMNEVYKELCKRLLTGFDFETVDTQVFEIKRLARVPYSRHDESKRSCIPVKTTTGKPIRVESIEQHKTQGLDVEIVETVYKLVYNKNRYRNEIKKRYDVRKNNYDIIDKSIRPCIQRLIQEATTTNFEMDHQPRLAILFECLINGWKEDDIVSIFSKQTDFDDKLTRYYINHAKDNGYTPFRCETLENDLKICFESCPIRKRRISKELL